MGRGSRDRPTKLGKKLAKIRTHLGVSQDGLVRALGLTTKLTRSDISKYERAGREPSLSVLLKYARAAKVNVEVLIDDDLSLSLSDVVKGTERTGLGRKS
jgi:transcriptional regulator with XRE-family HTH domain